MTDGICNIDFWKDVLTNLHFFYKQIGSGPSPLVKNPLVKDQRSFHEICSLAMSINIKAFNQVK